MELIRRMSMYALRQMSCTCASILMSSVKWNLRFFAVVENDTTLCPKEIVQFKVCVHLFGRIRRHSFFSSFNCNLFSIIQYFTSEMQMRFNFNLQYYVQLTDLQQYASNINNALGKIFK